MGKKRDGIAGARNRHKPILRSDRLDLDLDVKVFFDREGTLIWSTADEESDILYVSKGYWKIERYMHLVPVCSDRTGCEACTNSSCQLRVSYTLENFNVPGNDYYKLFTGILPERFEWLARGDRTLVGTLRFTPRVWKNKARSANSRKAFPYKGEILVKKITWTEPSKESPTPEMVVTDLGTIGEYSIRHDLKSDRRPMVSAPNWKSKEGKYIPYMTGTLAETFRTMIDIAYRRKYRKKLFAGTGHRPSCEDCR